MAKHNEALVIIAAKLGLAEEEKVLYKAAEFERLLQTKTIAGSNLTDTGKTVVCLDLAAALLGADLDLKTAIKYSGLKPAAYTNIRKVVQNLLELNEGCLSTMVLCNTLQCISVQNVADKILEEYQKHAKIVLDLSLPQYVCMAVFQACRVNKVKIPKSKILEKSHLKPAQWSKLDAEWSKFVDNTFISSKKKKGRPQKYADSDKDDVDDKMEVTSNTVKTDGSKEPKVESYDDWKRRILDGAYEELKTLELKKQEQNQYNNMVVSPRRSPRKTPQKFSPYKSPSKGAGIRLLFPVQ